MQRTGTQYTESLISAILGINILNSPIQPITNIPIIRSSPAQKHFRIFDDKSIIKMDPKYYNEIPIECLSDLDAQLKTWLRSESSCTMHTWYDPHYVVTIKDPFSWYYSICEWAKKCKWESQRPENNFHYFKEYREFYEKWMSLEEKNPDRVSIVRYEDILLSPAAKLTLIADKVGAAFNTLPTTNPSVNTAPPSQADNHRPDLRSGKLFTPERRKYYLDREYIDQIYDDFGKGAPQYLTEIIGDKILDRFNYTIV